MDKPALLSEANTAKPASEINAGGPSPRHTPSETPILSPPPPQQASTPFALCAAMPRTRRFPTSKTFPPRSPLEEGVHRLTQHSSFHYVKNAVRYTKADTESLWDDCYEKVPRAPNPMMPGTFLNRKQCTYGRAYSFGHQTSPCMGTVEDAPTIVAKCVAFAQLYCNTNFPDIDPKLYTMAHCNWYPNGSAGLGFHKDAEQAMVAGHPIFSFTFIDNHNGPLYRYFTVANDRAGKDVVAELALPHRGCLVMAGAFQKELYHGVVPTTRKAFRTQRRFNVTVRATSMPQKP